MSWREDANTGTAVGLSVGMVVTEADAVLKELAAESTVDMGVSGFRVAPGATAVFSVTTTSGASNRLSEANCLVNKAPSEESVISVRFLM